MARIHSAVQTGSEEFRRFYAHNHALATELRDKQNAARHVRPQRDVDRFLEYSAH